MCTSMWALTKPTSMVSLSVCLMQDMYLYHSNVWFTSKLQPACFFAVLSAVQL